MTIVVLYHGEVMSVEKPEGIKNLVKCHNPFCTKMVQTRPPNSSLAGRPKNYCDDKCRWQWKRKRTKEKKIRERLLRMEMMH